MESVTRLSSIPVVESTIRTAEDAYFRLKKTNRLFHWSLDRVETSLFSAVDTLRPGLKLLEGTISQFDSLLCKSLDLMEQKVPNLYLPPAMIYWNTKEYMSDRLIKRAESFKELGTAVLDSKVSNFAADKLDDFVVAADRCVDKYLPEGHYNGHGGENGGDLDKDDVDEVDNVDENKNSSNGSSTEIHVIQTIHRGQRLSKKLKRRLTIRTIAEAKALKKHSKEAIHVLFYAAELIVTDPKMALQKTQELWAYLSENEPENQARPETMEELLVLLTRETARRLVHFINFTRNAVVRFPETLKHTQYEMMQQLVRGTKALAQVIRTRPITSRLSSEIVAFQDRTARLYDEVQNFTANRLVNMHSGGLVVVMPRRQEEQNWAEEAQRGKLFRESQFLPQLSTNHHSRNNEYHLTLHCTIHSVITAERVAIYVSGRLSEEEKTPEITLTPVNNHIAAD